MFKVKSPREKSGNTRGHASPLVESVTTYPGHWTVEQRDDGIGATDNKRREMQVPIDFALCRCGTSHNSAIRAHELIHSKISPPSPEPVKMKMAGKGTITVEEDYVVAAEEFRVNHSLSTIEGHEKLEELWCPEAVHNIVYAYMDAGKYRDLILASIEGGPGYGDLIRTHLKKYRTTMKRNLTKAVFDSPAQEKAVQQKIKTIPIIMRAIQHVYHLGPATFLYEHLWDKEGVPVPKNQLPSWNFTERLAVFLKLYFDFDFPEVLKRIGSAGADADESDLSRLKAGMTREEEEFATRSHVTRDPDAPTIKVEVPDRDLGREDAEPRWGKPSKIYTAKLPHQLPPWRVQKYNKAVDEGTIPRYLHRWVVDQRIFQRTKRVAGGSILIDASGSMGLSKRQIDEILTLAPATTIALYAGVDGGDGGVIKVVAQDGKRADPSDLYPTAPDGRSYGGNGIDGPALDWLGEQAGPRIWITDGGVTGVDANFAALYKDAYMKCKKYKVTVARNGREAAEIIKTGNYKR